MNTDPTSVPRDEDRIDEVPVPHRYDYSPAGGRGWTAGGDYDVTQGADDEFSSITPRGLQAQVWIEDFNPYRVHRQVSLGEEMMSLAEFRTFISMCQNLLAVYENENNSAQGVID